MEEASRKKHNRENLLFQLPSVIKTGLTDIPSIDALLGSDGGVVAANDINVIFCRGTAHLFIHGGIDPVVTVHEGDVNAARLFKALLSGGHVAAVFLVEASDTSVLGGILVTEGRRIVGGTVVYKQHFEISESLSEYAVQAVSEVGFYIVDRDNNT